MSWSLNIGKMAGTVVRIHLTFLLFLAWIFAASYAPGGAATAWDSLVFMVLLFLCVLLHEFGHIFTARAFGVTTPYVTLLPIGGVAQLERIPGGAVGGIPHRHRRAAGERRDHHRAGGYSPARRCNRAPRPRSTTLKIPLVDRLAAVNLFLALFNMIPAFPMDGGRVLRALLASRFGYVRATEIAAAIGQFVAFALGFIGLLYNPILIFIAIFVYLAASSEAHMVALRAVSRGVPVSHAMMTQFATLTPQAHLDEAVQTLLHTSQSEFPVVDGAGKPVGVLGRGDLIRAIKTARARRPRRRRHDARTADHRPPPLPGGRLQAAAGEIGAGGRRHRCQRQAGRAGHLRDHRRDDDGAGGAAQRRALGPWSRPAGA